MEPTRRRPKKQSAAGQARSEKIKEGRKDLRNGGKKKGNAMGRKQKGGKSSQGGGPRERKNQGHSVTLRCDVLLRSG